MSNYKGYDGADNIRRKSNNIESDKDTGIKTMRRVKSWKCKQLEKNEEKAMRNHKKQSPVKVWTKDNGWHTIGKNGEIISLEE